MERDWTVVYNHRGYEIFVMNEAGEVDELGYRLWNVNASFRNIGDAIGFIDMSLDSRK